MALTQDQIPALQQRFNLTYHLPYLFQGENMVGFQGMDVLEVGGGGTRPTEDLSRRIQDIGTFADLKPHTLLEGLVEDLPACMENSFDRIFSIACFEHIHTLGLALEKMHAALKPGGKFLRCFPPSCPPMTATTCRI